MVPKTSKLQTKMVFIVNKKKISVMVSIMNFLENCKRLCILLTYSISFVIKYGLTERGTGEIVIIKINL